MISLGSSPRNAPSVLYGISGGVPSDILPQLLLGFFSEGLPKFRKQVFPRFLIEISYRGFQISAEFSQISVGDPPATFTIVSAWIYPLFPPRTPLEVCLRICLGSPCGMSVSGFPGIAFGVPFGVYAGVFFFLIYLS